MMTQKIINGRCSYCFGVVEPNAKSCPYCNSVFVCEQEEVKPPADAAALGYSKKEAKAARRIYDKGMQPRSSGYILWLFVAAAWILLGFLIKNFGELGEGTDGNSIFITFCVFAVLMLPLFFWGNARSKKKKKIQKAKSDALDPRLVERFRWEDEESSRKSKEFWAEMAEADRLAKEARKEERERQREKEEEQEHLLY